jgi:hypothetical protein
LKLKAERRSRGILGLVIEQDLFAHHWFELLVPFDQLEDEGEHFFQPVAPGGHG